MASENNKRIAKNTMFLYFRMLLVMGVSLFTVRIVLKVLGVEDYGIYNVVAGVVSMFGFLSGTMASASQRFFAFEIGKKDFVKLKQTFSMTVTIYAMLAILIIILAETVGLWFLNNKMTIPPDRMEAARWVYHFAIASFIVTIMAIPYNAAIIAKENMKVFAYISIIEVSLKLGIVYMLTLFDADKLKLYAVLMFIAQVIIRFSYSLYCRRAYTEFRYSFYWDRGLFKTLVGFSGWNMFGAVASVLNIHGINILLNVFFNPIVNAARGIAYQINMAVNQFVQNFMMAVKPQITKYYAEDNIAEMQNLVFRSSKFSFFLLSLLTMPIIVETNFVLSLWLVEVPEYAVIFTRLILIVALIDSLSYPLMTAAQATGNIKKYQSVVGSVLMLNVPISYVFLKFGFSPEITLYIAIFVSVTCLLLRLILLRNMINLSIQIFLKNVGLYCIIVILLGYVAPICLKYLIVDKNLLSFVLIVITGLLSLGLSMFFLGLTRNEKNYVLKIVRKK
ncbi:MAG: MATE family efflux transporter [Bacteroidales bacterium]|nr:MATE family efflux transporter [Bacteroidales bacterium]